MWSDSVEMKNCGRWEPVEIHVDSRKVMIVKPGAKEAVGIQRNENGLWTGADTYLDLLSVCPLPRKRNHARFCPTLSALLWRFLIIAFLERLRCSPTFRILRSSTFCEISFIVKPIYSTRPWTFFDVVCVSMTRNQLLRTLKLDSADQHFLQSGCFKDTHALRFECVHAVLLASASKVSGKVKATKKCWNGNWRCSNQLQPLAQKLLWTTSL